MKIREVGVEEGAAMANWLRLGKLEEILVVDEGKFLLSLPYRGGAAILGRAADTATLYPG